MPEKKRYIKFTFVESGASCLWNTDDTTWLQHELEEAKPGEVYTVEIVEMTQEEHDALPEFDGW